MSGQTKLKYLTLVILIGLLLLPKPAFAFIDAIFGFLDHLTESIEDIANPMMMKIISLLVVYALSIASLALSSHFLETFIVKQGEWLANLGPATQAGWNFTSGLANMLLILIFLIIAFAFIFKIETFQAKKALPKLIGVALLLNFSLLFVYMLTDISQFIYNTILTGSKSLFSEIMKTFVGNGVSILSSIFGWLALIISAWAIPFAHPFAQIGLTVLFSGLILPNIVIWTFQIFCFFALSSIFLTFIFLFGARVFVLQILAVLAPLAFVCLILPQTKSFWSQWFKTLLEWLLLGIFFLFFLILGFRVVGLLTPTIGNVPFPTPFGPLVWNQIGKYIAYYFGIFIYMAVILFLGKKFIPQGAQALIDFGKGIAGTVVTRGLKPVGKGAIASMREAAVRQKAMESKEETEAAAKGEEYAPKFWRRAGAAATAPVRFFHRLAGTTPELEKGKEIERKAKDLEEKFGKDTKSAKAVFPPWKLANASSKAALALYLARMKGDSDKGLKRLNPDQYNEALDALEALAPHRVEDVVKHRFASIEDKSVQDSMVSDGVNKDRNGEFKDKDVRLMYNLKIKINGQEIEELIKTEGKTKEQIEKDRRKVIKAAAQRKAIDALERADIDTLSYETLDNDGFQEATARWKNPAFIRALGEEKGLIYSDKIQDKAEEIGLKEIAKTNHGFIRMPYTPGGTMVTRRWKDLPGKPAADELIKTAMEEIKRQRTAQPPLKTPKEESHTGNSE